MDSKEGDDGETQKEAITLMEAITKHYERIEKFTSELNASGTSPSTSPELLNLYKQFQQLTNAFKKTTEQIKTPLWIHDEIDKVFDPEEVGHSCDLCQRDLATDPERPGGSLSSLQEACVLPCGHVYHFKCLKGTTLDLDNHSTNPSCIFCISFSN